MGIISFSEADNLAVLDPKQNLYDAALHGDWTKADEILKQHPSYIRDSITARKETLLHIAALGGNKIFVSNLVGMLNKSELEAKDEAGNTAFCHAVASGVVDNVTVMWEKNDNLPVICPNNGMAPLRLAALLGQKDMVTSLYNITRLDDYSQLSDLEWIKILEALIMSNMFGMHATLY